LDKYNSENKIEYINNKNEIDIYVGHLTDSIIYAADNSIPKKKYFQNSVPWWNKILDNKRKEVNRLRRLYQRTKSPNDRSLNKANYYYSKKEYQKLIFNSKAESWQKFCSEKEPWGLPYKIQGVPAKCDDVQLEYFLNSWADFSDPFFVINFSIWEIVSNMVAGVERNKNFSKIRCPRGDMTF